MLPDRLHHHIMFLATLFPLPNGYHPPVTPLDNIADLLLLFGLILMVVFTVAYGTLFKWTKTPAGKSVFSLLAAASALMLLSTLGRFSGGDYAGRDILRLVIYSLVPAAMIYMLITLLRNLIRGGPLYGVERRAETGPIATLDPPVEPGVPREHTAALDGEDAPPGATHV